MVQTFTTDGGTLPSDGRMIMGTDGSVAQFVKVDSDGELQVDIASIVPGSGATALGKAEDAVHSSGDTGVACLAVRRDSVVVGSGTDGDYSTLNVDANGRLYTSATIDAALPAGTNAIGKLAANSGVDIGDVDVASIAAGTNMIGNVNMGATIASGSVAMVQTTSTLIIAAAATRKRLILANRSNTAAEVVRIGPTAATTAMFTLYPSKVGTTDVQPSQLVLEGFTGAVYGYSESGTPTIEYIEILT